MQPRPLHFLLFFLLLNLLQAAFTDLFHDEAYYWLYAQALDWGYMEHPPLVALLIRIGYSLFQNELGVRLTTVLTHTLGTWLMWRMTDRRNPLLFFGILASCLSFHVSGLLAVPDAALFVSNALFWFFYQRYLAKADKWAVLALTFAVAAIAYSKYQGAMTIFFVLLSNPQLLKKGSFWLIFFAAFALYLPHLNWLYHNDFETFRFHLGTRTQASYTIDRTLNFLLAILLLCGPLTSLLLLRFGLAKRTENEFERSLKYVAWGVIVFLSLLTFKAHVEANWAASAFIPIVLLAYKELSQRVEVQKWFWRLALPSFVLFAVFRLFLVWDFLPSQWKVGTEFHGWRDWAKRVEQTAAGNAVVFENSYQYPSIYTFYTGKKAYSVVNQAYHRTQFQLWDTEADLQGKPVMMFYKWEMPGLAFVEIPGRRKLHYRFYETFNNFPQVGLQTSILSQPVSPNDSMRISVKLFSRDGEPVDLGRYACKPHFRYTVYKNKTQVVDYTFPAALAFVLQREKDTILTLKAPATPGNYSLLLNLSQAPCGDWSLNGRYVNFEVKD